MPLRFFRVRLEELARQLGSAMLTSLKLAGLALGFLGIAVAFLDLLGFFVYAERISLRDRIRNVPGGVARAVPGFEEFIKRFPPPDGVNQETITHIVKDVLQTHDQFPISITLRYLAAGERSAPVAAFFDVEKWATETRFGWISWIVAAVGWLIVASTELLQHRRHRSLVSQRPHPSAFES